MIDIPIRVRDALKEGSYRKNWRFSILKDDATTDFVIDKHYLVSESVNYDERMCSATKLKFGLCEGTNLDFQYFDKPNITGRHLKAEIGCEYEDLDGEIKTYYIPMGFFDVDECSRQASTGIIKASCYNKLLSDYLDSNLTTEVKSIITAGESGIAGSASMHYVLEKMLEGYSINTATEKTIATTVRGGGDRSFITFPIVNASNALTGQYMHIYWGESGFNITNTTNNYYKIYADIDSINTAYTVNVFPNYEDIRIRIPKNSGGVVAYSYISISDIWKNPSLFDTDSILNEWKGYFVPYVSAYNTNAVIFLKKFLIGAGKYESQELTNLRNDDEYYPIKASHLVYSYIDNQTDITSAQYTIAQQKFMSYPWNSIYNIAKINLSPAETFRLTTSNVGSITDGLTLRELQSATFELSTQFGKLDRETDLFSGVTLNGSRLYPAVSLYPRNDLYPLSTAESADKTMYSKLWGDEGNIHNFQYLIITYKGTDGEEHTLQRTVNTDGTDNYNMSDNWLFRNLSWSATDVGKYADEMVNLLKDVSWFPFEMWCAGLPYVEAGDEIEISIRGNTYTTYVLERTLKGIQNLQDEYINGSLNIF